MKTFGNESSRSTPSLSSSDTPSPSPSGLTGGSIIAQSGRSMVEMLGTLAIIGVLSIGGIAGYSYGMDKYRANQTINDVMLMGVDIITQLSQNRGEPTLSTDWGIKTTAGYDFTVIQNPEDDTQYGIQITGVPSGICKQVGDGLKQTVAVYVGSDDYNADTETDPCDESDSNTMEFYFEGGDNTGSKETTGEQCGDTVCGICQKCGCALNVSVTADSCGDNKACVPVADYEQKCTVDGQSGWCVSGTCEPETTCNCSEGQYCADTNEDSMKPTPSGQCIDLNFRTVEIDGTTYYISNNAMSWWDAVSACEALGNKKLLSVYDLVVSCEHEEDTGCTSTNTKLSDLSYQLAIFFDNDLVWTKDVTTPSTVYMVYISCSSCALYDAPRTYKGYYAVCR